MILLLILIVGIILPATPKSRKSLLFAETFKDSLLKYVPSPRIIFIGGSSLSFGLNSKMIFDSLGYNPINTGIQAGIGLLYMMDNTLEFIKSGDIVVVAPEYQQYFGKFAYGYTGDELLRTIVEISPNRIFDLKCTQWFGMLRYLPKYSFSKLNPRQYIFSENDLSIHYEVTSFNKYGDVYTHWKEKMEYFLPDSQIEERFNQSIINELLLFREKLQLKGAILFVTFPGYQATSFENNIVQILKVEKELMIGNFLLLGKPERYKMPDSTMFNGPYHLSEIGINLRTRYLIEDLNRKLLILK